MSDPVPARQAWWEFLVFPLPLLSALAAIGMYFLPYNIDLGVWVFITLLAFILSSIILAFGLGGLLEFGSLPGQPDSTHLGLMVAAVAVLGVITTLQFNGIGVYTWDWEAYADLRSPMVFAATSCVASLLLIVALFLGRTALAKLFRSILFLPLLCVLLLGVWFGANSIYGATIGSATTPSAPAASWPKVLAFAQQEADHIEAGSVAGYIQGEPDANRPYTVDTPFRITLEFLRPNGQTIRMEVLDTDQPKLHSIDANFNGGAATSLTASRQETLNALSKQVAAIRIGPRQAYALIADDGTRFQQAHKDEQWGVIIEVTTFLEDAHQMGYDTPVVWRANLMAQGDFPSYLIDAVSGKILWRGKLGESPSQTPQP